ncbi:MAG: signal peptidase II [Dorea sp.]|uniref:signal peptidase II n=1 Tax=Dorea sp. YH-dor226 TaxID=3151119 RepID=UPI0030666EBC|nr:signal peptidase II [Dorea sp.]
MNTHKKRYVYYMRALISICLLTILDQITKYAAVGNLKDKPSCVLIPGVFQLEYLENRGAAFGLFQNQRVFFLISVVIICIIVILFYSRVPFERRFLPLRICAVLLISGAFGNCIDRIRLGYVIDFFYFKLIDFPIFNVADIYVTVSAFLIILLIFFYYKEEELERILHR